MDSLKSNILGRGKKRGRPDSSDEETAPHPSSAPTDQNEDDAVSDDDQAMSDSSGASTIIDPEQQGEPQPESSGDAKFPQSRQQPPGKGRARTTAKMPAKVQSTRRRKDGKPTRKNPPKEPYPENGTPEEKAAYEKRHTPWSARTLLGHKRREKRKLKAWKEEDDALEASGKPRVHGPPYVRKYSSEEGSESDAEPDPRPPKKKRKKNDGAADTGNAAQLAQSQAASSSTITRLTLRQAALNKPGTAASGGGPGPPDDDNNSSDGDNDGNNGKNGRNSGNPNGHGRGHRGKRSPPSDNGDDNDDADGANTGRSANTRNPRTYRSNSRQPSDQQRMQMALENFKHSYDCVVEMILDQGIQDREARQIQAIRRATDRLREPKLSEFSTLFNDLRTWTQRFLANNNVGLGDFALAREEEPAEHVEHLVRRVAPHYEQGMCRTKRSAIAVCMAIIARRLYALIGFVAMEKGDEAIADAVAGLKPLKDVRMKKDVERARDLQRDHEKSKTAEPTPDGNAEVQQPGNAAASSEPRDFQRELQDLRLPEVNMYTAAHAMEACDLVHVDETMELWRSGYQAELVSGLQYLFSTDMSPELQEGLEDMLLKASKLNMVILAQAVNVEPFMPGRQEPSRCIPYDPGTMRIHPDDEDGTAPNPGWSFFDVMVYPGLQWVDKSGRLCKVSRSLGFSDLERETNNSSSKMMEHSYVANLDHLEASIDIAPDVSMNDAPSEVSAGPAPSTEQQTGSGDGVIAPESHGGHQSDPMDGVETGQNSQTHNQGPEVTDTPQLGPAPSGHGTLAYQPPTAESEPSPAAQP